jgi:hypothetical protein
MIRAIQMFTEAIIGRSVPEIEFFTSCFGGGVIGYFFYL